MPNLRTRTLHGFIAANKLTGWTTTASGADYTDSKGGTGRVSLIDDGVNYRCSWSLRDAEGTEDRITAAGAVHYVLQQLARARS